MTNRVYDRSTTTIEFDSGLKVTVWWRDSRPVACHVNTWRPVDLDLVMDRDGRQKDLANKILQDPEAIHTLIHMARNGKTLAQIMETLNV